MPHACRSLLKDYCSNCTIAGVHFIADDTKHWVERVVWAILVVLAWYGVSLLIIAAWDSFVENPISFGVETTYVDWETRLPAVAVCELLNVDKVYEVADTIWPPGHLLDLEDALKEIAFYRGISYTLVEVCHHAKNPNKLCPMENYTYYADLIRSDCPQIIRNCSYNGNMFDCCEYFQPIDTDIGTCFILNSIQTKEPNPYPMVCNRTHKTGIIKFEILLAAAVYTIGEDEIPSITTLQSATFKVQTKHTYSRRITVRNIENDPLVSSETSVEQRACHTRDENEGGLYPHYSYSACTIKCRKQAQIDTCGCNDHFMVGTSEAELCNITGMACLHSRATHLTTLKPNWATRPGMACNCLPSCHEAEITVIKDVIRTNRTLKKKAEVEIVLAYLPSERFKRRVVRSHLDLVVSVGGTTGLFVGASILSFVELIFYFSVRFVNNIWLDRRNYVKKRKKVKIILSDRVNDNAINVMNNSQKVGPLVKI
ncbi:sodium channel protein Nach-like [Amyelois transitella]|uniref:sodium channel protein Nach-like n=1 Tax=Amyelois transitella TaxID=680683 RepID=UPI002990168D|nr:sodium channel protein Nach-like [Amyelois transitella]